MGPFIKNLIAVQKTYNIYIIHILYHIITVLLNLSANTKYESQLQLPEKCCVLDSPAKR